jgi:hypothetical protein
MKLTPSDFEELSQTVILCRQLREESQAVRAESKKLIEDSRKLIEKSRRIFDKEKQLLMEISARLGSMSLQPQLKDAVAACLEFVETDSHYVSSD